MSRTMLTDSVEISDEKANELVNAFMIAIPTLPKSVISPVKTQANHVII